MAVGTTAPSILIVDDGELDGVQRLLARMQVDWVRCADPERGDALGKPRDLLITSGPRAMKGLNLVGGQSPLWLCIYDQDFLPLRERLRDLGVHYLVSNELAPRTFLLFLRQLLFQGQERRRVARIPLRCALDVEVGSRRSRGHLLELSRESCVFALDSLLDVGQKVGLRLAAAMFGGGPLELAGRVVRAERTAPDARAEHAAIAVLRFAWLDATASARIHDILTGQALGTQVTPLLDVLAPSGFDADWSPAPAGTASWDVEQGERRDGFRHHFPRKVEAIHWCGDAGLRTVLAHDLSPTGLRVSASPLPKVGSEVTLALYGREREEPLLLGASVVWAEMGEAGLRFEALSAGQARDLERLLASSPCAEDLKGDTGSVHLVELRR